MNMDKWISLTILGLCICLTVFMCYSCSVTEASSVARAKIESEADAACAKAGLEQKIYDGRRIWVKPNHN